MTDILANPEWKAVRILERDEVVLGGYGGNMNEQATALVARTELLMQEKADTSDIIQGQYSFSTLAEFDSKKATIPANSVVIIDEAGANQGSNTWDGTTLTKSAYDPYQQAKNLVDAQDSLILNTNKAYPFVQKTRNGTVSQKHSKLQSIIVDIQINNAHADYYYTVAGFANGSTLNAHAQGWTVYRIKKSDIDTSATFEEIVIRTTEQTELRKNTGLTTIELITKSIDPRTERIRVTVNTDALDTYGNNYAVPSVGGEGYSYVVSDDRCFSRNSTSSLLINLGQAFPFRPITLNSVESDRVSDLQSIILDAKIRNADTDYYYLINFFSNGYAASGYEPTGWIVNRIKKSLAVTSGTMEVVVARTVVQSALVKGTGVKKITLNASSGFNEEITLTVDTDSLRASGSTYSAPASTADGYSYVLDEQFVFDAPDPDLQKVIDEIENIKDSINVPVFLQGKYNNVTSTKSQLFFDLFKEVTVENAESGYYYNLAYYTNGSTVVAPNQPERWIVYKRKIDTSETENNQIGIITLQANQPELPKTGNIEEITLTALVGFSEIVKIKVDTSKLPAYGTYIKATGVADAMYSWYINPKYYSVTSNNTETPNFKFDASAKSFELSFKSENYKYKWGFGLNGANNLPNFKSLARTNTTTGLVESINSFDSDWLPPLIVQAVNDTDSGASTFTGGNHRVDGATTAENELYEIEVNGSLINKAVNLDAIASSLKVKICNKVMAYNTVTLRRYVLRQVFDLEFFQDGSVTVHCQILPIEEIRLVTDYALQCHTNGFNDTVLMLNSQYANRITWSATLNSGERQNYPKAWAVLFKGSAGLLGMWIDRTYANGIAEANIAPALPLIFGGNTTTKFYLGAYRAGTGLVALPLTTTSDYKWRGGYVMGDSKVVTGFDSVVKLDKLCSIINAELYF